MISTILNTRVIFRRPSYYDKAMVMGGVKWTSYRDKRVTGVDNKHTNEVSKFVGNTHKIPNNILISEVYD